MQYNEQFLLDAKRDNSAGIRYRVSWNQHSAAFSLGYRIEIDKWIQEAHQVKPNTTHGPKKIPARRINRRIAEWQNYTDQIFKLFENPTLEEFKTEFNIMRGKIERDPELTFFDAFEIFRREVGTKHRWTRIEHGRYKELKRRLLEINPNFCLDNFTESDLNQIVGWYIQNEYINTTIVKVIKQLKRFLKWSKINGYYSGTAHETYSIKLKGSKGKNQVIYFTWEELMKLWNYEPTTERLDKVRDFIIFLCFTGLRFSDYYNLNPSDFTKDGIYITTQKDVDRVMIEFNKYSREIAEKYDYNLPKISNVKANKYLKELCKILEFNEPIKIIKFSGNRRIEEENPKHELVTTHIGRKTFIVNGLRLGISSEVIMKWTGHSDYAAMRPYIQIVDELKRNEMNKFNI